MRRSRNAEIDEVLLGHVVAAGCGQAPARQASISAGVPESVGAATINKVCGSGLFAIMTADRAIRSGDARIVAAGGMESMSRGPHLLRGARSGWKYGTGELLDSTEYDGLRCSFGATGMGCYADATAAKYGITREDQDAFAVRSQRLANEAAQTGAFHNELVAITVQQGKSTATLAQDESPRPDTTLEDLAKLRPAFGTNGTATAGNSSPLSDGAAATIVVAETLGRSLDTPWAFRIAAQSVAAGPPAELFTAPVEAIRKAVKAADKTLNEIDLFEINEAFASQMLACERLLEIDANKLNVHGGAIALGHPIGASGARVVVTLLHALVRREERWGVAALCLGGGEAVAMVVERVR
ncbi:MAG: thiolase family protein [Pirellulales bacterium]